MKEAGCRLLIVGFESGDPQILKNIKKGATVEQAREFMKHCRKLGLVVHGDFQVGHPGETPETIERTIQFAMELDPETIQVSMSHPYPGTEFDAYLKKHNYAVDTVMTDEGGHQLPVFQYPGLSRRDIMRSEEHTSELQSPCNLVCRLLLEKKKKKTTRLIARCTDGSHHVAALDVP